ncbi:hypothetical protein D0Z66_04775 [Cereibacter sphaeroides]|nr:hypothetical protein D0Z66_04775 [Cereibacter sphaeroides]
MVRPMFDKQSLDIPCPNCGKKTKKTVGWIKTHDSFTCSGCARDISLDKKDLVSGLKAAEKSMKGLFAGFGKIR